MTSMDPGSRGSAANYAGMLAIAAVVVLIALNRVVVSLKLS